MYAFAYMVKKRGLWIHEYKEESSAEKKQQSIRKVVNVLLFEYSLAKTVNVDFSLVCVLCLCWKRVYMHNKKDSFPLLYAISCLCGKRLHVKYRIFVTFHASH